MNASAFTAALYTFCAGISFALAASIWQPARIRSEIDALHFTLSSLGIWYLTRSLKTLGALGGAGLLDQFDADAGTMLLAGGAAFLAATLLRLSGQPIEYRLQLMLIAINTTIVSRMQFAKLIDLTGHAASLRAFWIGYWIFAAFTLLIGVRVLVLLNASRVTRRERWAFFTLVCGGLIALLVFPVMRAGSSAAERGAWCRFW